MGRKTFTPSINVIDNVLLISGTVFIYVPVVQQRCRKGGGGGGGVPGVTI